MRRSPATVSNSRDPGDPCKSIASGSRPSTRRWNSESNRVSPSHSPWPSGRAAVISPLGADTVKERFSLRTARLADNRFVRSCAPGRANRAHCGANRRLRAVDRLAPPEVELVAGAPAAGAALADQLDPLRVFRALADIDHQAHQAAVVREAAVHPRVALALTLQALMPADEQRRVGVEMDVVDWGEQRDDREDVGDEVRDDADVRRGSGQRLLLENLDPDLFDALEEVAKRALFGQEHLQQPDLALEVVMVGGHDLDAAGRGVKGFAVSLGRRAERLLDEDDIAKVVVER